MSGTSAVTAVIYAGTTQSLNSLARDLLACGTLYQSCLRVVPALVSSLRVVAACSDCFPFQQIVSLFGIKSFLQAY